MKISLLLCAGITLLPSQAPAETNEIPTVTLNILQQRAAFHLSGRVVDQDGAPLNDVRLSVDVHRFDPDSLESPGQSRVLELADGRFAVQEDNATALQLRATKTGYLPVHWQIHYLEVLTARQAELKREDLRETNTNLVLVLERVDGGPAFEPTVLPTLSVSSNNLESVCSLFPSADEEPRQDLRLVLTPTENGNWKLALHAGPDGGIQPAGSEHHLAPTHEYRSSIALPTPRRYASASFFLKTRESWYARVDVHIAKRPGPGAYVLEVYDAVLQTDGSRALVLDIQEDLP